MAARIEKNIPIPKPRSDVHRKYPFPDMEVGDSFLATKEKSRAAFSRITMAGNSFGKKRNPRWRFAARKTADGIRIWRIE